MRYKGDRAGYVVEGEFADRFRPGGVDRREGHHQALRGADGGLLDGADLRLAAWRELARHAPPAVLADALGVSAGTAVRHAFLGGAGWSAYAARRRAHTPDDKTS